MNALLVVNFVKRTSSCLQASEMNVLDASLLFLPVERLLPILSNGKRLPVSVRFARVNTLGLNDLIPSFLLSSPFLYTEQLLGLCHWARDTFTHIEVQPIHHVDLERLHYLNL